MTVVLKSENKVMTNPRREAGLDIVEAGFTACLNDCSYIAVLEKACQDMVMGKVYRVIHVSDECKEPSKLVEMACFIAVKDSKAAIVDKLSISIDDIYYAAKSREWRVAVLDCRKLTSAREDAGCDLVSIATYICLDELRRISELFA